MLFATEGVIFQRKGTDKKNPTREECYKHKKGCFISLKK